MHKGGHNHSLGFHRPVITAQFAILAREMPHSGLAGRHTVPILVKSFKQHCFVIYLVFCLLGYEIDHSLVFLLHYSIKKKPAMPKRHENIVKDCLNGFF